MKLTNLQLVAFVLKVLAMGARYWYGTFGTKATTSLYNQKKAQYPSHYTSARAAQYKKDINAEKMVCDCMGLIKWFFWSLNNTRATKYADGFPDISANQCIASYCEKTGSIGTLPEIPGLVLWCSGHIGVYIGDGWAIEARGFAYGVVKTRVSERSWTKWGRLKSKYITYEDSTALPQPETGEVLGARELKLTTPLTKGEDVRALQKLLIGWNYSCGKWGADGDFGSATEAALIAWQYANGLPETGVADEAVYAVIQKLLHPDEDGGNDPGDDDTQDGTGDEPEPDQPERYVTVTDGNTVNVRTAPNTSASILGIAYRGDSFEYAGQTSPDGWHNILHGSDVGWISGKYTTLGDAPVDDKPVTVDKPNAVILDLSQHNGLKNKKNDWAKLAKTVDLLILRCGVTRTETAPIGIGKDDDFAYAAQKCIDHKIPFGVYWYNKFPNTVKGNDAKIAETKKEAKKCWDIASPYNPLFYCSDIEEGMLTTASIGAFADELRRLGARKVGMYIGHNYYPAFKGAVPKYDFTWIPRYGKNTGKYDPKYNPAYLCAIHQYTSKGDGKAYGLEDSTVDVNRLTGLMPLSYFTS